MKNTNSQQSSKELLVIEFALLLVLTLMFGAVLFGVSMNYYDRLYPLPKQSYENRPYSESGATQTKSVVDDPTSGESRPSQNDPIPSNTPLDDSSEFIRQKRDLNAQEGMWRSTNLLAVMGFLQFIFGIPALIMIALTLKATRDTLIEAHGATLAANKTATAAESAERSYLHVTFETEYRLESKNGDEERAVINITAVLHNYGKTPAFLLETDVNRTEHRKGNHTFHQNDSRKKFFVSKDSFLGAGNEVPIAHIVYLDIFDLSKNDAERICTVYCDIVYKDVNEKYYAHCTKTTFHIATQHRMLFGEVDKEGRRMLVDTRMDSWEGGEIIYTTEITLSKEIKEDEVAGIIGTHENAW